MTFYRWNSQDGGLGVGEVKRLKALEDENRRLKQIVADQALDLEAMRTIAEGKPAAGVQARSGAGGDVASWPERASSVLAGGSCGGELVLPAEPEPGECASAGAAARLVGGASGVRIAADDGAGAVGVRRIELQAGGAPCMPVQICSCCGARSEGDGVHLRWLIRHFYAPMGEPQRPADGRFRRRSGETALCKPPKSLFKLPVRG